MPQSPADSPQNPAVPNQSGTSQSHATPPAGSLKSGVGEAAKKISDAADEALRSMPLSSEAERAVLSCMLLDPHVIIPKAVEHLGPGFFYIPGHRIIFETILHLYKTRPNGDLDIITLTAELTDRGQIDAVGGPQFVSDLLDELPTTSLWEHYTEILKSKFILRRVIQDCTESAALAYDRPEDAAVFLDSVEKRIFKIRDETENSKEIKDMQEIVMDLVETIEELYNSDGTGSAGISSGFPDLDEMTNGFHGGEMIVIAARPSMGKTSFAMNIVENVAIEGDTAVAVFSLEMSSEQLVQRVLCSRSKIQMQKLRGGFLSKSDFPKLMHFAAQMQNAPIWIDDTPGISINELQAKARRLKQQHDIKMIMIDYLQLLKSPDTGKRDGREKEVAEISGGLKGIAKELNVPVIVLAQLNRQPDARSGGTPKMSDLRESGAIEQDADLVGLLMRDKYYAESEEEREEKEGLAKLIIAKQRNGPTGEVPLTFNEASMRFETRAKSDGDGFDH
ncbi:MAG: replicative DNA helicase [Verrucomicrobiales bacterium]|nr:replicative DNA helicase [Verrucomicrobiales bacterium]